MKAVLQELDNTFRLELTAETVEEATILVRLKLNERKGDVEMIAHALCKEIYLEVLFGATVQFYEILGRGK